MSVDNTQTDFQREYGLWLEALLVQSGFSRGRIAEEVRKTARSLAENSQDQNDARSLSDAAVRNWFSRLSLPSENRPILLKALTAVVGRLVTERPLGANRSLGFSEVVQGLKEQHFGNSKVGRKIPQISEALLGSESLLLPIAPSIQADGKKMFLGSWAFNGQVPPYCERSVDTELRDRLSDVVSRFTFLVGPPKSGKTRTLLEALKNSSKADWPLLWISPALGAVDRILDQLAGLQMKNLVFIFDDLQKFHFDSDRGLNYQKFEELSRFGIVIGTLHISAIERWQAARISNIPITDRGLPGSKSLDLVLPNVLNLNSRLDEQELAVADQLLKGTIADTQEITYLPAWLASVDSLIAQASLLRDGDAVEQSILSALLDTKILYPEGATIDIYKNLAKARFNFQAPNGYWSDLAFEAAVQDLTDGVTPGSPHSVLMLNLDNPDKYSLMDSVWEELRPLAWRTEHLDIETLGHEFVADAAMKEGFYETTLNVLSTLGPLLEGRHFHTLGLSSQYLHDLSEAEKWHSLGAEYGEALCLAALVEILMAKSDFSGAEKAIVDYGLLPIAEADAYRGLMAHLQGDKHSAKAHFMAAAAGGSPQGAYNLAVLYFDEGAFELTLKYATQATEGGLETGKLYLAVGLFRAGEWTAAEKLLTETAWFPPSQVLLAEACLFRSDLERASEHLVNAESLLEDYLGAGFCMDEDRIRASIAVTQIELLIARKEYLAAQDALEKIISVDVAAFQNSLTRLKGVILSELGNLEEAIPLLESLPQDAYANYDLGVVYLRQGRLEDAEMAFMRSSQLGYKRGHLTLANLFVEKGRYADAIPYFEVAQASEATRIGATLGLGYAALKLGRLAEARSIFERLHEMPIAMNNLGVLAMMEGDEEKAIEHYKRAAQLGEPLAMINLCDIYSKKGDFGLAREFAQLGADIGDPGSIFRCGLLELHDENPEAAKKSFERAADLGHGGAANDLGVIYLESGDTSRAKSWFTSAAEKGELFGMQNLAFVYWEENDEANARNYFLMAETKGDRLSSWMLAELDLENKEPHSAEARLMKLADEDYVPAMCALSDLYADVNKVRDSNRWRKKALGAENIEAIQEYIEFCQKSDTPERAFRWSSDDV